MAQEFVRLVVEIDASKVAPASARMRNEFGAAVRAMDADSRRAQESVVAIGERSLGAARMGALAMRSMSAGIGAATAAAAAQQRSWLSLGTTILASFAAGGPVVGGIALVAAGIGLVSSSADQAEESMRRLIASAKAAASEMRDAFVDAGAAAERAGERRIEALARQEQELSQKLRSVRQTAGLALDDGREIDAALQARRRLLPELDAEGTFGAKQRRKSVEEEIDLLVKLRAAYLRIGEARSKLASKPWDFGVPSQSQVDDLRKAQREFQELAASTSEALGEQAGSLETQLRTLRDALATEEMREKFRRDELAGGSLRQAAALQRVFNGEKAEEVRLDQEIEDITARILVLDRLRTKEAQTEADDLREVLRGKQELLDVIRGINRATAARDMQWELRMMRAITDEQRAQVALEREIEQKRAAGWSEAGIAELVALRARQPMLDFARELQSTLQGALTSAIVDGLTNGFRNGMDIVRQLINQLLTQVVGSLVNTGLNAVFGALFGGAGLGGGGGIASLATGAIGSVVGGGGGAASSIVPLPDLGGGCANGMCSIPGYAQGGVVSRPTLALIGEGGEREFVIPESRLRRGAGPGGFNLANLIINAAPGQDPLAIARAAVAELSRRMARSRRTRRAFGDAGRGSLFG